MKSLRVAWRWKSDNYGPTPEFYYRVTPLMADGVLYTTAGIRRTVVALDATTGETLWIYRLDESARGVTSAPPELGARRLVLAQQDRGRAESRADDFPGLSASSRSIHAPASRFRLSATRASSI